MGPPEGGSVEVLSRVGESTGLTRLASRLEGAVQKEVDQLTAKLTAGNLKPGSGTRSLFNGILEARTKGGARVAFRYVENKIEILAKFDKKDQVRALKILQRLYGK